jgi:O-antigen ligase
MLDFLAISPLTGFGGAGIYVLSSEYSSAHNQFFDFLIRFGIVGLILFIYFNIRIIKHFWFREPYVVALIMTYFVFGLAHETTKYSYGAVIFFYLLSLTYSQNFKEQ